MTIKYYERYDYGIPKRCNKKIARIVSCSPKIDYNRLDGLFLSMELRLVNEEGKMNRYCLYKDKAIESFMEDLRVSTSEKIEGNIIEEYFPPEDKEFKQVTWIKVNKNLLGLF